MIDTAKSVRSYSRRSLSILSTEKTFSLKPKEIPTGFESRPRYSTLYTRNQDTVLQTQFMGILDRILEMATDVSYRIGLTLERVEEGLLNPVEDGWIPKEPGVSEVGEKSQAPEPAAGLAAGSYPAKPAKKPEPRNKTLCKNQCRASKGTKPTQARIPVRNSTNDMAGAVLSVDFDELKSAVRALRLFGPATTASAASFLSDYDACSDDYVDDDDGDDKCKTPDVIPGGVGVALSWCGCPGCGDELDEMPEEKENIEDEEEYVMLDDAADGFELVEAEDEEGK